MAQNRLELSIFNFSVDSKSLKSQAPPSAQFVAPPKVSRPSSSAIKEQIAKSNKNFDATVGLNDRDSSQAPNDISRFSDQKDRGDMRAAPERQSLGTPMSRVDERQGDSQKDPYE